MDGREFFPFILGPTRKKFYFEVISDGQICIFYICFFIIRILLKMILSSKLCKLIIMLSFVLVSETTKVMGSREPRVSESFNKSKSSKLIRVEFKKQSKGTCLLSWAAFPRSVVTVSFQFKIGEVKNKKSICRRSHICVSLCVHM